MFPGLFLMCCVFRYSLFTWLNYIGYSCLFGVGRICFFVVFRFGVVCDGFFYLRVMLSFEGGLFGELLLQTKSGRPGNEQENGRKTIHWCAQTVARMLRSCTWKRTGQRSY